MNRSLPGVLTLTIALANAAAAAAEPITIITADQRRVAALTTTESPQAQQADTLLARAGEPGSGVSTATLTSSYADPMHWFGTGTADISATVAGVYIASSTFRVDFTVTSPITYTFTTTASLSSEFAAACCGFASTVTSFGLRHASTFPIFTFASGVAETGSDAIFRSFTGLLMPGDYFLMAHAGTRLFDGTGTGSGTFAFTFDLAPSDSAPVPEPASLLLVATGVAGVFGYRRRRGSDLVRRGSATDPIA